MKRSRTEDPEFERAHQKKDVLKLWKLLKNINFNYKRSKEPIKTLWQTNNDVINPKQHKMDLTMCFKKLKTTEKIIEDLKQATNGHTTVEILCKE